MGAGHLGVQLLEHGRRIRALDDDRVPALAGQVGLDVLVAGPTEDGRPRDLVAVQLQDRQDRSVAPGIEEGRDLPRRREGTRLGLAVTDDAGDEQVRVVEGGACRVHQRVAELAALVDAAGRLHADVARDAAGGGELPHQRGQSGEVLADAGVDLGVGALEVGVRHECGPAVSGTRDVEAVLPGLPDQPVQRDVHEGQRGTGAPVAQQAWLDVLDRQGLAQQRVGLEVDLRHRQVVGCVPPSKVLIEVSRVGHERSPRAEVRMVRAPNHRSVATRQCRALLRGVEQHVVSGNS